MIGHLKGVVIFSCNKHIILDVGGIGYKIYISPDTASSISEEETISLWAHLVVKEDMLDLYGFLTMQELDLFKLLIGISGIGPKGALGVMSVASVEALCSAIGAGDTSYLTKVSGIGKKTAERVVLELREKISSTTSSGNQDGTGGTATSDEIDALVALGYSLVQARDTLRSVDPDIKDTGKGGLT